MKRFKITGSGFDNAFLEILHEVEGGYFVRIVRERDGYAKATEEFMNKELFDMCARTGYISACEEAAFAVA